MHTAGHNMRRGNGRAFITHVHTHHKYDRGCGVLTGTMVPQCTKAYYMLNASFGALIKRNPTQHSH